jgi:23S rRNA (adenine2503-C2)-methyltransferase
MTFAELREVFAVRYGKGPFLANAFYREFFQALNPRAWQAPALEPSPLLAQRLAEDLTLAPGQVADAVARDGVVKFVTVLPDGCRIESVILPMQTHATVCVSSQVGCRMGCLFCETGRRGLVRQLTVEEIVGQVYAARREFQRAVRNVVFMGMGEPFDNFANVIQAVRVLNDQRGLDIALRYITVSTAGRTDGIRRLAALNLPQLKLAVSLNAPNDALRRRLMPSKQAAGLDRLQAALARYPLKKGHSLMVAYVLIPGVNDGAEHARQLAAWLAPLKAKVNLIPYNPGTNGAWRAPTADEAEAFRQVLIASRVNVQARTPRGRELMAACGQLGGAGGPAIPSEASFGAI